MSSDLPSSYEPSHAPGEKNIKVTLIVRVFFFSTCEYKCEYMGLLGIFPLGRMSKPPRGADVGRQLFRPSPPFGNRAIYPTGLALNSYRLPCCPQVNWKRLSPPLHGHKNQDSVKTGFLRGNGGGKCLLFCLRQKMSCCECLQIKSLL